MFSVRMSKFGDLYTAYNSRATGIDIQSATGGGPTATEQTITFDASVNTRWLGGTIVFLSGSNTGFGSKIISDNWNGSSFTEVGVDDPFDLSISAGDDYVVLVRRTLTLGQPYVIADSLIQSVNFSTNITAGFSQANIGLSGNNISQRVSDYLGQHIVIHDSFSDVCWEGLVNDVLLDNLGGEISCVGYADTFSRYHYYNVYAAGDANVSVITILADIISENPYLSLSEVCLDRGGVIHAAQAGTLPAYDFTEAPTKASDAISKVLLMGATPYSSYPVYLQVWGNRIPQLRVINPNPTSAQWVVRTNNLAASSGSFSIESSMSGIRNVVFGGYTDENNVSLQTNRTFDLDLFVKFGPIEESINTGQLGLAEITLAQGLLLEDKSSLVSPSRLSVSGYIGQYGTGSLFPCWRIRAGDVIDIAPDADGVLLSKNRLFNGTKFVVGETSYDSATGVLDLYVYKSPDLIQSYIDTIDIGVE